MEILGITYYAAIVVIVYLIGMGAKNCPLDNKWIPLICGASGLVLGVVSYLFGVGIPAQDVLDAAAIGTVSGLAATGLDQLAKQLNH